MSEIKITVETTPEDWSAFLKECDQQAKKLVKSPWWHSLINIVVWAVIAFCFMWLFQGVHYPTAFFVSAIFISAGVVGFFAFRKVQAAYEPTANGVFIGNHEYLFTPSRIVSQGENYQSELSWPAIQRIDQNVNYIYLYIDTAYALILPKRCTANEPQLYEKLCTLKAESNEV